MLSQGGRGFFVKAVVQAIPSYAMPCLSFPWGFCNKLDALIHKFLWGGSEEGKKIHWKNWDIILSPKFVGGLCFRNF